MFITAVTGQHPPTISPLVYFSPCKRCYSYPGFIGELGPVNELAQGYMVKAQGQDSNSGLPGSKFYPVTAMVMVSMVTVSMVTVSMVEMQA